MRYTDIEKGGKRLSGKRVSSYNTKKRILPLPFLNKKCYTGQGLTNRGIKDDEKDKLQVEVLAKDGIAVIVNKEDSKINDLTKDQLKEIFSGKIKNTADLSK